MIDRFVLFDELGRWTKVLDGRAGELAMLSAILCEPQRYKLCLSNSFLVLG